MATALHLDMLWASTLTTLALAIPLLIFISWRTEQSLRVFMPFFTLALLSCAWFSIVSGTVSEPYLDEIFHIPQAQKYCNGRFFDWDDKITTPPGLYFFSILLQKTSNAIGMPWISNCDTSSLRITNVLSLIVLAALSLLCRHEIESRSYEARSSKPLTVVSTYAVHTAFNTAMFPLLFFFSGLYYTDVVSTTVVLGAYLHHLKRIGRDSSSFSSDLATIVIGTLALLMRQTNVFWIVVWMGGLEAVHAVKTLRPERVEQPTFTAVWDQMRFFAWRYSVGDIHDLPLSLSWPDDMLFTVISSGIAIVCNPIRVARQIWPYVSILGIFASFVVWNGGVVLGDKSNHVATIHLAQLLYIWPFFAFFSLPLFLPYFICLMSLVATIFSGKFSESSLGIGSSQSNISGSINAPSGLRNSASKNAAGKDGVSKSTKADENSSKQPPALKMLAYVFNAKWYNWSVYILATLVASRAIVKYNTIIHPFTLADNRHYMFYIFRYTIRRGPRVRELLIIPYTVSRWLVWGAFAGCTEWTLSNHRTLTSPFTSYPFWISSPGNRRQTEAVYPKDITRRGHISSQAEIKRQASASQDDALDISTQSASTSTGLIFLLATSLSLMTAPLVEPRYFIIPWIMWRLLVPAWRAANHDVPYSFLNNIASNSFAGKLVSLSRRYDLRLVIETIWFITINAVTGYIFLTKPYVWKDEHGKVLDDGRLQRFMW